MKIYVIAAISRNRALGYQGKLIYNIREDLQRFRRLTERHTVIMGRKTFESLPNGALPLRHNIVISRTLPEADMNNWTSDDTTLDVCVSLDEALDICRKRNEREVFIIGGASIYQQVVDMGIADKVHFLGFLPEKELRQAYADCDIFVLPSVARSEAFGIVQLEAMVYGKPVINTDLPSGVPYVSLDEKTGITVMPSDADALAKAIERLAADSELRERFGKAAAERVNSEFSEKNVINKLYKVLSERRADK